MSIIFENTVVNDDGLGVAVRSMRNPMNSWEHGDSKLKGPSKASFELGPNDLALAKSLVSAGTDHRKFMRMIVVYVDIVAPLYWWKEFDTYKVGTVSNSCSTMHKIAEKEFTLGDFSCEHLFSSGLTDEDTDCYIELDDLDILEPSDILMVTIQMLNKARSLYLEYTDRAKNGDKYAQRHAKEYWWQMIQLLPSSYNQRRTVMMSYEVLANIYKSRKNHKLDEWSIGFMAWIRSLPYYEFITGDESDE